MLSIYMAIVAKDNNLFTFVDIDSNSLTVVRRATVTEPYIIPETRGKILLNFSIDENRRVAETQGSFDRLSVKDGTTPHIVVQELATSVGTIVGYRLLNPQTNMIFALKKEDIIKRQSSSSVPLLQNGIIRGNKINCYSHSKFPRFIIGTRTRTAVRRPKVVDEKKVQAAKNNDFLSQFSPEQRRELSKAKSNDIDIRLIANPNLSSEQMRVLWISKKNGAYSEYFAKPEYSVDVMKFYADRLVTQQMVKECADLLARPSYSVDKLSELYLAVCEGIDYSSFLDADNAEEMYVQRERLREDLWGSSVSDSDYVNDAVKLAEKLKRG